MHWGFNRKAAIEELVFPSFPLAPTGSLTNSPLPKAGLAFGSWKWHLTEPVTDGINIDIRTKGVWNIPTGENSEVFQPANVLIFGVPRTKKFRNKVNN